jgi:uncharacterized Zn finger protein
MRKIEKPSPTESPLSFEFDPQPAEEMLTALGGLPLVVQAFRSLGLPASVKQHLVVKERQRGYDEQRTAEATKLRAEDLANRARYLEQLGRRQLEIWKQVAAHIQTRQPKDYERAVSLLADLHDLAVSRGRTAGFQRALVKIRQVHAAKGSFMRRLAKANL